MELVVDANIVAGYFTEDVIGKKHNLTESAIKIFDLEDPENLIFLDDEGQIEQEWEGVVDQQWFVEWYTDLLKLGKVTLIKVNKDPMIIKNLQEFGFPKGKDIWYIRVAKEVSSKDKKSILVTEDIDFYDPKKKSSNSKTRLRIIRNGGALSKYLNKMENIQVLCVENCLKCL